MGKTQRMMDGMIKGFAMLGGAAGIGRFITSTVKSADSLQKLSIKLGTTTDFLSKLEYAASISGVEMNTVSKALEKMQKSANDAGRGLSTARDGFATLGIEVEEFINLSPEQQFQLMIEKLGGVANQSVRTGTAMDLMGRSGAEMLKIVAGGPQVFNDLMLKAEDLGGVLKQDAADGAAAVADAFTDVATTWSGLLRDAVLSATDGFIAFANVLRDAGEFVREYSKQIQFVAVVLIELFVIRKITALVVAMSGAMKVATFSARGLGIALKGMLGGIPGLIAMAGTAFLFFRDDVEETTVSLKNNADAVEDLRREYSQFNKIKLELTIAKLRPRLDAVGASLREWKQHLESLGPPAQQVIGDIDLMDEGLGGVIQIQDREIEILENLQSEYNDLSVELSIANEQLGKLAASDKDVRKGFVRSKNDVAGYQSKLDKFVESVKGANEDSELFHDKLFALDELYIDGEINLQTYKKTLDALGVSFGDGADEVKTFSGRMRDLAKEASDSFKDMASHAQSFVDDMVSGISNGFVYILFEQGKLKRAEKDRHKDALEDIKKRYDDEIAALNTMLSSGEISHDEYNKQLKEKYDEYVGEKVEAEEEFRDNMAEINKSIGDQMKDILLGAFKNVLQQMLEAWLKSKIYGWLSGTSAGGASLFGWMVDALKTTGTDGGESFISTVGAALKAGAGKIGAVISSIFSGSSFASSGALIPDGVGGFMTAGTNAATSFMGGFKTALSGAAGFAVPLAIAAFGFGKSAKFKKALRAKFAEVMSDPEIVANLADGPLAGGFKVLGQVGEQTFAQIGSASAAMFAQFSETSGGVFKDTGGTLDYISFSLSEMKDEFGNVIVTAENFSGLLEYMEQMEPFSKHAQHLIDTIPAYERAKDSISLIDSELLKVKVQFKNMGNEAKIALKKVDMGSTMVANIMQRDFVTAADWAAMGMENLGSMSSTMFEKLIAFAQDATGEMKHLASMAHRSMDATQRALDMRSSLGDAGLQHGGSFVVGGGGGTDSQRVSFMATPGERVTVETPNQSKASGSDGGNVVRELRALRKDLATVVAKPIVGAVTRGQLAMAGGARH